MKTVVLILGVLLVFGFSFSPKIGKLNQGIKKKHAERAVNLQNPFYHRLLWDNSVTRSKIRYTTFSWPKTTTQDCQGSLLLKLSWTGEHCNVQRVDISLSFTDFVVSFLACVSAFKLINSFLVFGKSKKKTNGKEKFTIRFGAFNGTEKTADAAEAKRWKSWLELGENLSLIKFKPTRAKGGRWPNDTQLHPSWKLGSSWLELEVPFGQGFRDCMMYGFLFYFRNITGDENGRRSLSDMDKPTTESPTQAPPALQPFMTQNIPLVRASLLLNKPDVQMAAIWIDVNGNVDFDYKPKDRNVAGDKPVKVNKPQHTCGPPSAILKGRENYLVCRIMSKGPRQDYVHAEQSLRDQVANNGSRDGVETLSCQSEGATAVVHALLFNVQIRILVSIIFQWWFFNWGGNCPPCPPASYGHDAYHLSFYR